MKRIDAEHLGKQRGGVRDITAKIEALTGEPGFIYTLAFILMRDLFFVPEEAADINWHEHLSFQEITFLTGLLIKHEINFTIPTEEDCAQRFKVIDQLFLDLHRVHYKGFFAKLIGGKRPEETLEDNHRRTFGAGEMMMEPIFYSGSGAYDFQYLEFAIHKYHRDEPWLQSQMSIDVPLIVQITQELKILHDRRFADRARVAAGDFPALCRAALSVFCFEKADLHGFGDDAVAALIKAFSLVPGSVNQGLELPGQYNRLQSHPIVQLPDGRYFLPVAFNLSESIYESPFYWMNGDTSYVGQALRHRGDFAEQITSQLLKNVFGDDNVYTNVEVKKDKGHSVTDIDVLAIAGNKAVVAQVKSKRLTELAKLGDEDRLKADFQAAVQDAYDQSLLARRAVIDKSNRLLVGGKELKLNESLDDAYILCITLDNYPAVTHQVDVYLKKKPDDPFPIALSIFDLDILAFYLKNPFEFLYYLRQRTMLATFFKADSEITLLGFHIKHKLFKNRDTQMEMLDNSFAQLIDANFPVLRGSVPKSSATAKLYPEWKNEQFQRLVEQIKSAGDPGFTDALFFLYDLSGKGADKLIEILTVTKRKATADHLSHDARLLYGDIRAGVTILSANVAPDILRTNLLGLATVSKYRSKADMWLALGSLAGSPNLVDAVAFTKEPWKKDATLEEMITQLPKRGTVRDGSGHKIGRNDPCPCGSGRKFKRCHGA